MEHLKRILEDPPAEYRAVPFWSWNDKLEGEELRWQIREMKEKGIGGFFMHARGGLLTEYMSDEWMECIRTSTEEAKRLGMEAWLYDEEGWPSGFAGGRVTALGDYYHMRWMEQEESTVQDIHWEQPILGIYAEDGTYLGKERDIPCLKEHRTVYVVYEKKNPYYVDVLNPKVIRKFIEVTHEEYLKIFEKDLGEAMPGFFTDEPQFAKLKIPWSVCLPEEFRKEHGYPAEKVYSALFRQCGDYEKYRYDFWKTVSRMYTDGFCHTIYEWCRQNHCKLTGHLMREDSVLFQMQATAGVMPSYEYMDMPGIDWLRRRISSPLTPKQVGSAAAQLGKKFVLSEMFAMTGWDCTPEEFRWIASWQYVNGVNRMCQHLEAYSIKGIRKRDFPPSLFYQQSWWEEYRKFNDYFARLGVILTRGQSGAEVLLLHPLRSGWLLYEGKDEGEIVDFGERFEEFSQYLSDIHVEHHYGDEELMRRHGSVEDDMLRIGACKYKVVVIPDMLTMDKSTLKLLLRFSEAGGKIYSAGRFPEYIDGRQATEELGRLRQYVIPADRERLKQCISADQEFPVSISENGVETREVHIQLRKDADTRFLYITNLSRIHKTKSLVCLPGILKVSVYEPLDNTIRRCQTRIEDGNTLTELDLNEMEGTVLILEQAEDGMAACDVCEAETVYLSSGGRWEIRECEPNAMLLDDCSYRIDSGEWQEKVPVIRLMDILLGKRKPVHVSLKFEFEMETEPDKNSAFYIGAEFRKTLRTEINGVYAELREEGWWKDKSIRLYDIRSYLKKGRNQIILEIDFKQPQKVYDVLFGENVLETELNKLTYETELENIYLVGRFGVFDRSGYRYSWRKELIGDGDFTIREFPGYVYGEELTSQGFCFFAGKLKLAQKLVLHDFDDSRDVKIRSTRGYRYIYRFGKPDSAYAKLYVNGEKVRDVLWAPWECDITSFVHPGENEIVWELYASNRNLLGPHHHIDGELYAVWPADFTDKPSPFKADEREVWSDKYHFVKFGL